MTNSTTTAAAGSALPEPWRVEHLRAAVVLANTASIPLSTPVARDLLKLTGMTGEQAMDALRQGADMAAAIFGPAELGASGGT